ncbi:MAG: NAD+ synthase [Desulfovibrio sp.]|jgi:NAD+ synthase/NAD+ synthase (glutamine-hydrolysing)|nr:NAD+ synthase [Desulfovibrio sp.]
MRCALLQINSTVGDISGNAEKIVQGMRKAAEAGADLCVTPELALIGYPPRDMLLYPAFAEKAEQSLRDIARATAGGEPGLIVGSIGSNASGSGKPLRNQAVFIRRGRIEARYSKRLLPTYDVFDEARYFEPGDSPCLIEHCGLRLALTVCEDIWNDSAFLTVPSYAVEPLAGHPPFDLLVNVSASPFTVGKQARREDMLTRLARKYAAHAVYVNAIGGNDDLIFDGRSMLAAPAGTLAARARGFEEDLLLVDIPAPLPFPAMDESAPEAEILQALVTGTRDYCLKTGQSSVVLGLSGGIDSSLTAAVAVRALGPDNVLGLLMPSPYSSGHSLADALELAGNLGIETRTLNIEPVMLAYDVILAQDFAGRAPNAAEENLQARIRGNLLMAFANKFNKLLLTTGNKSEISVGYCTIYGDMCGALAVIGDVYKTDVFRLCRRLNAERGPCIPENVLLKPPSAELRPNQTDRDSLPSYDELDAVLQLMLEERRSPEEVVAAGYARETVLKTAALVQGAEFKRRQAAPVLKITAQAFGVGWRMPVACRGVWTP